MEEIWRPIDGYKYYEVSSYGRIRSVDRVVYGINGHRYRYIGRIRKTTTHPLGYKYVTLKNDGVAKRLPVHRLVAKAFIPNPLNKPCVNHIDNDPSNNKADNLEWCTNKENSQWMLKQGRADRTEQWLSRLDKGLDKMRKPIVGTNIYTGEKIYFDGINRVKKAGFSPSCVSCICRGIKYPSGIHKDYKWEFVESEVVRNGM